ncbi:restriction endonuclease subunit S [Salinimicrobium sp. 3283s]|uniref:restriction endonuclease subunit S n=1 Tax=Salinimicrobium sp. 3283s TaxID=3114359 RepID=UPI0031EB260C
MSYLEKWLEGVDMEWKRLEDIAIFSNGKGHEKAINNDGQFIVVNSKFISTGGKVVKYTDLQICPLFIDDVLIVMSDLPNGKALAKTFLIDENEKYTLNQRIGSITIKNKTTLLPKFFNYYLNRTPQLLQFNNGIDQTNLRKKQILDVRIPIPPLHIQKEIVSILDTFTELTTELRTELTTEFTARKQQYSYYREQLFSFKEGEVEYLPMGQENIGKFIRGGGLQKKDFTDTGVGCFHYGQIYTHYGTYTDKTKTFVSEEFAQKARKAKHGDLVIATTSENDEDLCKAVAWLGNEEVAVSSDACFYQHNLNPKYVAYFFQTEKFQKQKRPYITGTKVRRVNADNLAKIKIPIPPLEEQERIVSILDKFDTLATSISEGLPKEIELRQKQYEYYRERLLTFPQQERA